MTDTPNVPAPEAMRDIVREYVRAVHATYLDHVRHLPPGARAALPLVPGGEVSVVAAAARELHLIASTQSFSSGDGPVASVDDEYAGLRWRVHFLDPSVLPALGLFEDDNPAAVRRELGIDDIVYHLVVTAGGSPSTHHAQHSAVALANQHTALSRDADHLRRALPRQGDLVEELITCARLGLDRAAVLLAGELTSGRVPATDHGDAHSSLRSVLTDVARP